MLMLCMRTFAVSVKQKNGDCYFIFKLKDYTYEKVEDGQICNTIIFIITNGVIDKISALQSNNFELFLYLKKCLN